MATFGPLWGDRAGRGSPPAEWGARGPAATFSAQTSGRREAGPKPRLGEAPHPGLGAASLAHADRPGLCVSSQTDWRRTNKTRINHSPAPGPVSGSRRSRRQMCRSGRRNARNKLDDKTRGPLACRSRAQLWRAARPAATRSEPLVIDGPAARHARRRDIFINWPRGFGPAGSQVARSPADELVTSRLVRIRMRRAAAPFRPKSRPARAG